MRSTTLSCLNGGEGRTFYAVGGTWRALARLHMAQMGYPLHVMHGYLIRAEEALEFSKLVHRVNPETLSQIEVVERRPPSAAAIRRAGSRTHRARGRAARGRVLGARRARRAALFAARRRGAQERRAARRRPGVEPAALALAAARRGADRMDRRVHGDVGHRREFRGEAASPRRMSRWPTSAGARIRTIAASSR